jgi:dipeptidyl aminopeptidase/acylaminoacyl peptidase
MSESSQSTRRGLRYWRNLALFTGLLMLIIACAFFVFLANSVAATVNPAPVAITRYPEDVGITDYRDVAFVTGDGVTLRGWFVPSQNGAAIILVHGYSGSRMDLLPEAGVLARQGYGLLLFDLRGHGLSDDVQITLGDRERRDLRAAVDFVIAQPDVDPDRIGAIGFSMGATTLTLAAAEDPRLSAVVIEAAFPTLEDLINDRLHLPGLLRGAVARFVAWRLDVDIDDVRPVDALCNISPRPVLLIYGDEDDTVPPDTQARMFAAVCANTETWLMAGASHDNYTKYALADEYLTRLVEFFGRALGP